jgi:hypothetical protein
MSSSPNDDPVSDGEEQLRTDVRIAIELALEKILDSDEQRDITRVEEEKLTHFAIRDLNLELTYSWYLAGVSTVATANPDTRSQMHTGPNFGSLKADQPVNDRIKELRDYFASEEFFLGYTLRDVWFTDKFEFLRDYYSELAPNEYRELYIHSLDLRQQLWNLTDRLESDQKNASLSDFGGGSSIGLIDQSAENEFRYSVSDFHMDLAEVDELTWLKQDVVRGTGVLERVYSKLTQLDSASLEQKMLLDEIHDYFYNYVWKYPALAISAETAEGPNADALSRRRLIELDGFDKRLNAEIENLTSQSQQLGLLPGIDEPVSNDFNKSAYLHSIIKESVDTR